MDDAPLTAHLAALRRAVLRSVFGVLVAFPFCFAAAPRAIGVLVRVSVPEALRPLHYFAPMEAFLAQLQVAFVVAVVVAWPWVALQAWDFARPGLTDTESRTLRRFVPLSAALFVGGALFSCFAVMPLMMSFSASFAGPGLAPVIGLWPYLRFAGSMALGFGAMAQTPLVLAIAARLGFATAQGMRNARPWAVVVILALSAVLTPPDVASQLLLAVPTMALYEIGVVLAARCAK